MNDAVTLPNWLTQFNADDMQQAWPLWMLSHRKENWDAFLQHGFPARKNERYKYTDFSFIDALTFMPSKKQNVEYLREIVDMYRLRKPGTKLQVLVNGYYAPELSDVDLPKGLVVLKLQDAFSQHADIIEQAFSIKYDAASYPLASLNAAQFQDGIFIYSSDEIETQIHILSLGVGAEAFCSQTCNVFAAAKNSKLNLFIEYASDTSVPYMMNDTDIVVAKDNAKIAINKFQHENSKASHIAHTFCHQEKNSLVTYNTFAIGANFYRDDIVANLAQSGAECKTSGFYRLTHDGQYIDNHIDINHQAAHTNSEMLYKGILDKKSKAVFNGRLHVQPDAQKILAYQANHNILLGKDAEVYTKPELEIYADDVKCKHGATIGQIDQDALFYLRARGINKQEAMNILLRGFADELLTKIESSLIRDHIKEMVIK